MEQQEVFKKFFIVVSDYRIWIEKAGLLSKTSGFSFSMKEAVLTIKRTLD